MNLQEKQQNAFINDLLEKVELLTKKANHKDYKPTNYEREQFSKILTIINNMSKWF